MDIESDDAGFYSADALDEIRDTLSDSKSEFSSFSSENENDTFDDDINGVEAFPDFIPKENANVEQNSSESATLSLKNRAGKENFKSNSISNIANFLDVGQGKFVSTSNPSKHQNLILSIQHDNYTVSVFKEKEFVQDDLIPKKVLCTRGEHLKQFKMSHEGISSAGLMSPQFSARKEKSYCHPLKKHTFSSVKMKKNLPDPLKKMRSIGTSRCSYSQSKETLKCFNNKRRTFKCQVCKLTVTSNSNLKSHLTRVHFNRSQIAQSSWKTLLKLVIQ